MGKTVPDIRLPSLQAYIADREKGIASEDGAPAYAHPVDHWILRTLGSTPVRTVLDGAIDAYVSTEMGQEIAEGLPIDGKSFPDLFEVLTHCADTLGIPLPHAVALDSAELFNAFTAGTDAYAFIGITSGLCGFFSPGEATFVIGHECGHIAARHMEYHTLVAILAGTIPLLLGPLGAILSRTAGVPLQAWSRRSEITADRAGLLCCGDLRTAERALLRLVAGHADVDQVDIEDYLRKARDVEQYHGLSGWRQLFRSHPLIPKRIEALRLFARSELFFDLAHQERARGVQLLSRSELDRRVNDIVKP